MSLILQNFRVSRVIRPRIGLIHKFHSPGQISPNLNQVRRFKLSAPQLKVAKNYGFVVNILAGAYIGGLIVCLGSLYFMYLDANQRQHIPFELSFRNQITAVKAINKDDVLKSPRYAVKHYRRLLIELAKEVDPNLNYDENDPKTRYYVPIIPSDILMYEKSPDFANFYIDIVARYAKALLAKGLLQPSIYVLNSIIHDDLLFYKLGDAERLSQCCRLLSKVAPDFNQRIGILERSIDMLTKTFSNIYIDENYLIEENSRVTDEILFCLNDLAFNMAKLNNKNALDHALNIYLSNLKVLTLLKQNLLDGNVNQAQYPLFNCSQSNLTLSINQIKSHISEIMWVKKYKKNAISWSEEIIDSMYFDHNNSPATSKLLIDVLTNLIKMYDNKKDLVSKNRCIKLREQLNVYEVEEMSWYDSVINRFSKIIYNKGPLGIIEKPLTERFGKPQPIPEIEEFEDEDVE